MSPIVVALHPPPIPATLAPPWILPCSFTIEEIHASTWSLLLTSTTVPVTLYLESKSVHSREVELKLTVSSSPSLLISLAKTMAPSFARTCTTARPIPLPPPVTVIIRSFKDILAAGEVKTQHRIIYPDKSWDYISLSAIHRAN